MNTQTNWLTLPQAAQKMGIRAHSLSNWLAKHKDIQDQYVTKTGSKELTGRKCYLLREDALVVIATMKGNFQGNRKKSSDVMFSQEGKKRFAEKALQNIQVEGLMLKTAQILEQLNARVEKLEKREPEKKEEKQLLLSAPNASDTFRKLLNSRIRDFAAKNHAVYNDLWRTLYEEFRQKTKFDLRLLARERQCDPLDVAQ